MPSFSFILLTVSEKNFEYFFENLPFMLPSQPIKLSDLDESLMKHGGLLSKHFCKMKFELVQDIMDVLVTCKYKEDPIKNKGARVLTRFSPL